MDNCLERSVTFPNSNISKNGEHILNQEVFVCGTLILTTWFLESLEIRNDRKTTISPLKIKQKNKIKTEGGLYIKNLPNAVMVFS